MSPEALKCNKCDFVTSWTSALKLHLKTHSGEKWTSATSVTFHPLMQAFLGYVWAVKKVKTKNKWNWIEFATPQTHMLCNTYMNICSRSFSKPCNTFDIKPLGMTSLSKSSVFSSDRSSYSDGGLFCIYIGPRSHFHAFMPIHLVFLFENWMQINNNWPWTSFSLLFSPYAPMISMILSVFSWFLFVGAYLRSL